MVVDRNEAGALLKDVAGTEQRVRQFLVYANVGPYLILWGVIWFVAYSVTHILGTFGSGWISVMWTGAVAVGAVSSVVIRNKNRDCAEGAARSWDPRPAIAAFAFLGFGVLWTFLGHLGWREQAVFYPTLFGVLFFVMGLWIGRLIALCGIVLMALALAGYFWSGAWLDVWMAVVGGGALISAGLWLRN